MVHRDAIHIEEIKYIDIGFSFVKHIFLVLPSFSFDRPISPWHNDQVKQSYLSYNKCNKDFLVDPPIFYLKTPGY